MSSPLTAPLLAARLVKVAVPSPVSIAETEQKAQAIIDQARATAEQILTQVRAEAAQVMDAARAEARASADRQVAEALIEARAAVARDVAGMRPLMASILGDALEKLIGERGNEAALYKAVDAAIERIGQATAIRIRVNPAEVDPLRDHLRATQSPQRPLVLVETDASMPLRRARLSTAGLTVEVDLADQIALFRALITGHEAA